MLTTSCDLVKGAPRQSKICIPAFDPQRAFLGAAPLPAALEPDLFAGDGFHPNRRAHAIWGEEIAALALPFVT